MPRDNERIIQICAELSQHSRKALVELLGAGAPIELISDLLHGFRGLENVASSLSQPRHHGEFPPPPAPAFDLPDEAIRRATTTALTPLIEKLDELDAIASKIAEKLERSNLEVPQ